MNKTRADFSIIEKLLHFFSINQSSHRTYDEYEIDFIDGNTRLTVKTYCILCNNELKTVKYYKRLANGRLELINVDRRNW